jgi:hypothetical protein
MRSLFDQDSKGGGLESFQALGHSGTHDIDQARAISGEWYQRERTGLGMKLRRDAIMRSGVLEVYGQRGLLVTKTIGSDPGSLPTKRAASVGPDHQSRTHPRAARKHNQNLVLPRVDRQRGRVEALQMRESGGARVQRRHKMPILNIVAERLDPYVVGLKQDRRSTHQSPRSVDHSDSSKRRCVGTASLPNLERLERADRPHEQRGRAVVRRALRGGDERGLDTCRRKRKRSREACWAAADNGHLNPCGFAIIGLHRGALKRLSVHHAVAIEFVVEFTTLRLGAGISRL